VADLIDSDLKDWNVGLIKAVFVEEEAKVILNIPLSPCLPNDRLIWMGTKHGGFTVRSAYHLGKELQEREEGQCSKMEKGEEVWKAIWALEVPNTVKLFTWRACNNLLPTKVNLFHKRVVDTMQCPCCGIEDETIYHALWECPAARDVWGGKNLVFKNVIVLEQILKTCLLIVWAGLIRKN
jgi:hypothetical protein